MLTDRRERPFNPNFGAGLRSRLFQQMTQDDLDALKQSVSSQVEAYFPNVQVNSLEIIGDPDSYTITITMTYSLKNLRTTDSLVVRIQNG
jgi:phage baseplate assembly protein W